MLLAMGENESDCFVLGQEGDSHLVAVLISENVCSSYPHKSECQKEIDGLAKGSPRGGEAGDTSPGPPNLF